MSKTPFEELITIAGQYGSASYENYSIIRSLAERLREGFCSYLAADGEPCVFLVPPKAGFTPMAYGSGAFSVSGKGFLPLAPISFGLAVRVSEQADWLRVVFICAVEGTQLKIHIEGGKSFDLDLPLQDQAVQNLHEPLFRHIHDWFHNRVEQFEQGSYGGREIGFEIIHAPKTP